MNKGKLYGIGVGPGDSKLLTVKAVEAIRAADMIITPKTEKKEGSVAFNIAKPYISDKTAILPMVFQMSRDMEAVEKQWAENRKIIAEKLDEGKNLVFLTLGDPTVYSTYIYVHKRIQELVYETEIINGIPSFCAVAARLNMGLVEQKELLHVIPASYEVKELLKLPGTRVLMKAGKQMSAVKQELLEAGVKAVMIENCGMPDEKIYRTTEEIPEKAGYYSLIIIKDRED